MGLKRKTLIKMKNGRHRVATAGEVELQDRLNAAKVREGYLRNGLNRAREEGMNMILQQKYLPDMLDHMAHELAKALGKELTPHADKLMQADRTRMRDRPLLLSARIDDMATRTYTTIEGVIPALHYRMVLA